MKRKDLEEIELIFRRAAERLIEDGQLKHLLLLVAEEFQSQIIDRRRFKHGRTDEE